MATPKLAPQAAALLKPVDVSRYLGVSIATLYDWRTDRKGPPAIKFGKLLRYRQSDLDAWCDAQTQDFAS